MAQAWIAGRDEAFEGLAGMPAFGLSRDDLQPGLLSPPGGKRLDVFEYIELFYNPKRKHTNNGTLSSVGFEERQFNLEKAGV